jgi:hypothetical protein
VARAATASNCRSCPIRNARRNEPNVTGWTIKRFVQTSRRYRTISIRARNDLLTAEQPLPVDLRDALALIT